MKNNRPVFRSPDFQEQRGDRFLMIWGNLPYWTVVDAELKNLLTSLDGTMTLAQVTKSLIDRKQRQDASKAIKLLATRGAVTYEKAVNPKRVPNDNTRIENIAVNVTRRCNLRCRFCYNLGSLVASSEDELGLDDIISVLDASRPFWGDTPALSVLGGEPLLEEDKTLGLITFAQKNGLVPIVSTNGTLVTPGFAKHAAKHAAEIQVSLDGAIEKTSDEVRGKGNFDRAVRGIKTLVEARAYTILSMVCHKDNFSELEQFYKMGLTLGVNEVRFIPLKRIGGADTSGFEPVPLDKLITFAVSLFREHPEYKPLTGRDAFSILASSCQHAYARTSCGTGVQTFLLDANGDIYPCLNTNTDSLRVANVRQADFSFAEIWRKSSVLQNVRISTAICSEKNACKRCEIKHWCLGGCRGETLVTRGDLRLNAWNCGEQKKAIEETMWALSETPDIVRLAQPLRF